MLARNLTPSRGIIAPHEHHANPSGDEIPQEVARLLSLEQVAPPARVRGCGGEAPAKR